MKTTTFILDAINRLTALIQILDINHVNSIKGQNQTQKVFLTFIEYVCYNTPIFNIKLMVQHKITPLNLFGTENKKKQ